MRDYKAILMVGVMHNLNNYLQTIIGNATLGINSYNGCDTKNHLRVILATADRCSKTIQKMMDLFLTGESESSVVDVVSVLSETIDIFNPIAGDATRISYSYEDVPCVYGNESDISHILLNLLFNAREAIQNNGEIWVRVYRDNHDMQSPKDENDTMDYVCISVKDNGPGIPENIQEILFNEVTSTKKEGTHKGIGLIVSKFLAECHDGWIECARTDHTGTEFVVYFQVCDG